MNDKRGREAPGGQPIEGAVGIGARGSERLHGVKSYRPGHMTPLACNWTIDWKGKEK
jgi:hypothetical protein